MLEVAPLKNRPSVYQRRIQTFDLICRHDCDFRLPFVKFNCAGDADGFPLDHGKSLIGGYPGSGCNESGEPLIWVLSSEIDKCGPQWAGRHRDNPATHLDLFADILNGFRIFYHYWLARTRRNRTEKQSEHCDEK